MARADFSAKVLFQRLRQRYPDVSLRLVPRCERHLRAFQLRGVLAAPAPPWDQRLQFGLGSLNPHTEALLHLLDFGIPLPLQLRDLALQPVAVPLNLPALLLTSLGRLNG